MSVQASPERVAMPNGDLFDLWAEVYDSQENPFFSLEQQVLDELMPDLHGLDVLDAGCGTGRLFGYLKERGVRRLVGVDSSAAMARHAAARGTAEIFAGTCDSLSVPGEEFDVAVSSFVLSYVAHLEGVAEEMMRVCRAGAAMIISDMHPETAQKLGWKRTFRYENEAITLPWFRRSIVEVITAFEIAGWRLEVCEERAFTARESPTFERAGRSGQLEEIQKYPALYALRFRKQAKEMACMSFMGARCAVNAREACLRNLLVEDETIADSTVDLAEGNSLSLKGMLILPGLINAHDHLEFALYPRMGRGPYPNATEWAADIQKIYVQEIIQQKRVPREIRVLWGALRNLLSGVTTVCHHNPLLPMMLTKDFPVEVVRCMRWAHSLSVEVDIQSRAREGDQRNPFLVHAAEGVDEIARKEFDQLQVMGLIGSKTVLVHGLGLSTSQASKLNEAGAAVILCPSSNQFLFDYVPSTTLLKQLQNTALGSDSPLTADGDLLDEVCFAKNIVGVDPERLYQMVTADSGKILNLRNGEGYLAENGVANFVAVADSGQNPAEVLSRLSWRDVELVVRRGRIFLASGKMFVRLPEALREGLEQMWVEDEERWVHAPLAEMFEHATPVMLDGRLFLTGREVRDGGA